MPEQTFAELPVGYRRERKLYFPLLVLYFCVHRGREQYSARDFGPEGDMQHVVLLLSQLDIRYEMRTAPSILDLTFSHHVQTSPV
jgi:hypothetical protein